MIFILNEMVSMVMIVLLDFIIIKIDNFKFLLKFLNIVYNNTLIKKLKSYIIFTINK